MKRTHDINQSATSFSSHAGIPTCRTIDCGRSASGQDDFCPRCREEIDAIRDTARRRFVIWGTSGVKRAAGGQSLIAGAAEHVLDPLARSDSGPLCYRAEGR